MSIKNTVLQEPCRGRRGGRIAMDRLQDAGLGRESGLDTARVFRDATEWDVRECYKMKS